MADTVRRLPNPLLVEAASQLMSLWLRSLRFRIDAADPSLVPAADMAGGPFIYAIWHDTAMTPGLLYGGSRLAVLVSGSRDGDFASGVLARFGWDTVRGSSSRGGTGAYRAMVRQLRQRRRSMIITADGPRGPRHVVKDGAIHLAARTGVPVVPCGLALDRPWRLKSWDRFQIPRPFCRAVVRFGPALHFTRDEADTGAARLGDAIDAADRHAADRLATPAAALVHRVA